MSGAGSRRVWILRARATVALAVVTPLGFGAKVYSGPFDTWLNNSAAGALYEVFWCLVVFWLWARPERAGAIALGVFGATCLLEFLQLVDSPALRAIRSTFLGRALIGTTFAWMDLAYYAAGSLLGWGLLRTLSRGSGNVGTGS